MKIIGMSGNCSKEDVYNWKLNIDLFIEKPFSIEEFYDGIKNASTSPINFMSSVILVSGWLVG